MNGVIYARYSSDNQREESIEGQLRECMAFADKNDIQIVGTYIDRALSAKTDNRPDFQRMVKESSGRAFEVVIVWKLDRFARNRYDSAHYKAQLRKNGVKVISATETISEGAEGILLESMLEGMAEYYSAELAEKVNRGLTENALKCRHNGGTPPIGYTVDENQMYQIDPVTAPLVLKAFTDYANGKPMLQIVDMLNLAGVRSIHNTKLNINTVTRMLHSRKYIGEYKYGDVVTPGGMPAIVPADIFDRVQERLAKTKRAPAKAKAEVEYLLTTKLFCGKCGLMMVGESGKSHTGTMYHYYKCAGAKTHKTCDKKAVKKEWIEDLVIDQIKLLLADDELLDKLADVGVERMNKENAMLPVLKKQYAEVEKGINNFLNAIQKGIITDSTKQRLEELESRKKELSVQIAKEELTKKPVYTKDHFIHWFEYLRGLDIKKISHRRRLIDSFVNSIYLYDDRFIITFNFTNDSKTITFAELEEAHAGSDLSSCASPPKSTPKGCFFYEKTSHFPFLLKVFFRNIERSVHKICRSDFAAEIKVTVYIRRRADVGVTEPVLYFLHGGTFGKEQRSAGVPQIVKAYLAQTVLFEYRLELRRYRIGVKQISERIDENISDIPLIVRFSADAPVVFLLFFQHGQLALEIIDKRKCAQTGLGFCPVLENDLLYAVDLGFKRDVAYRDRVCFKINGVPAQTERFASAKSVERGHLYKKRIRMILRYLK